MSRAVIPWDQLPARLPIHTTALAYLLLDRWSAAGWVWGVVGTVLALFWLAAALRMWNDKPKPLPGYGS